MNEKWWKEANVYQIYPRSFMDSNGDGIGDLKGVTQKLDYIKEMGFDAIWLCPFFSSPNVDNGYDISDYCGIMEDFGTMEDCDELIREANKRDIKIIIDLVVNHTSDMHPWFLESKKSRDNKYSDYYIWKDKPNNWGAWFSNGSAWEYVPERGQYYLHIYAPQMPDLNFENVNVRKEVYDMMKWWIDKGVSGFRMDSIIFIAKHPDFPDTEKSEDREYGEHYPYTSYQPKLYDYLKEMNDEVLEKNNMMSVGETCAATVEQYLKLCAEESHEINMAFHFENMRIRNGELDKWSNVPVKLNVIKDIFNKWQYGVKGKAWNTLVWNNHDNARSASRYCDEKYWKQSVKMLAMTQYLQQGTVYVYQGEEIGMTNVDFTSMEQFRDVEAIRQYEAFLNMGWSEEKAFETVKENCRDNSRTPMQWDDSENAGFTTGTPWIGIPANYKYINVKQQKEDKDSILNFYKKLLHLKHKNRTLIYGDYEYISDTPEDVYVYKRILNGEEITVICNLTSDIQTYNIPDGEILISNYEGKENGKLRPYESLAVKTK